MVIEAINLLALVGAVFVYMVIGFLWYSPVLFAKPWMKLMGYTPESMKEAQNEMGTLYLLSALGALVTAFVLAQLFKWLLPDTLNLALGISFMIWVGFIAPVQFTEVLFGKKQMNLFLINTGYQLSGILAMGAVIFYLA